MQKDESKIKDGALSVRCIEFNYVASRETCNFHRTLRGQLFGQGMDRRKGVDLILQFENTAQPMEGVGSDKGVRESGLR